MWGQELVIAMRCAARKQPVAVAFGWQVGGAGWGWGLELL